jgi:arylsulfatase A
MKSLTSILAFALILQVSCFAQEEKPEPARPWNFLVILLDDAGWQDLGFSGNDFAETPHLDKLAARSMVFKQGYATHPFCCPTRQSMVSGQWPARTAWQRAEEVSPRAADGGGPPWCPASAFAWTKNTPEFTSLAEALKSKGYRTGHIGKWHFAGKGRDTSPEAEGFDVNFGGHHEVGAVKNFFAPFEGLPGNVESKPGEYLTDRLTDETLAFIRDNKDRPFFVQLWHYAPHDPIQAPEAIVEKYRKKSREMGNDQLNPTYAAMLESIDTGVGRIFSELEKLGIADNTVILLASDNGGVRSFGFIPVARLDPLRGEKGVVYEGGVRVPIAIHWPGKTRAASSSEHPVSVLDFYPTILDIAGVPLPENQPVDGVSLAPLLRGEAQDELKERPNFWYNVTKGLKEDGTFFQPVAAVRKGDFKLIKQFPDKLELYHLAKDPSEKHNLAEKQSGRTERMERLLDRWLKDTGVALPVANPDYDPSFTISRQVPNETLPADAKPLLSWQPGAEDGGWSAGQMVLTEKIDGVLRITAKGGYPSIRTGLKQALAEGRYAVQVRLRVPTSGRIRFSCGGRKAGADVVEFNPRRDGEWHTLTGIFQTKGEVDTLTLAGPTHLKEIGFYDPAVHTDYYEVSDIALFKLP